MLRDTLLSLCTVTIHRGVRLEVLVIDNDPYRSAAAPTLEFSQQCPESLEVRYIVEPRIGLSFARNRGVDEARGAVVAFLDDDVLVSEGWLVALIDCLERTGAAAVGGRIRTRWEGEPDAPVLACEPQLFTYDRGTHDFLFRGRCLPGGGNLALRRSVFSGGLRFSSDLGRIGAVLLSGEETALLLGLQRQGQAVWYCAGALVWHRVGGERLMPAYHVRKHFWDGRSYAMIERRIHGSVGQTCRAGVRLGKLILIDVPRWAVARLRRDPAGQFMARCSLARQVGYLSATVALRAPGAEPGVGHESDLR
jgi:GT2 family glycosyltransferase